MAKECPDVKACNEKAWLITEEMRIKLIHAKVSFVWETVFSHPSRLDVVQHAKENGYIIKLIFVTTRSADINLERVASRVKQGGHPVDTQKVITRYWKTMALLPEIMESANMTRVYDNSEWGKQPKLVVAIEEDNIVLYARAPGWAIAAIHQLMRKTAETGSKRYRLSVCDNRLMN